MIRAIKDRFFEKDKHVVLPRTLDRKKTFILPTREGLLFFVILIAMLAGSTNYNNNLGLLLTFLLGSMSLVSMFHTYKGMSGIQIDSIRSKPVFAGRKAIFEITVQIDHGIRPAMTFELFGKLFESDSWTADLFPGENKINLMIPSKKRGLLSSDSLVISTIYPLGLFRSWSKIFVKAHCLVYPAPIHGPLSLGKGQGKNEAGEGVTIGPGTDDFEGIRPYHPGDSLQRVDWKAFSRGRGLMVKEFSAKAGTNFMVDWKTVNVKNTEKRLSCMCDMVLKAHAMKIEYGLCLPDRLIAPDSGQTHKNRCLKALALFSDVDQDNEKQN
ncbi:DUF58 domain-containing protein [Desulfobacterales bacterium HSG16]|nr:DUF58 domain-containing protein [Desulfobacterales bacterium HSG16]